MARTAPAPNIPPIPGMCPGVAVMGGGGDGGGGSGDSSKNGKGKKKAGTDKDKKDASGDEKNGGCGEGDPICPITGRMFVDFFDFGFGGPLELRWMRSYSSRASDVPSEIGFGWTHAYGWALRIERRRATVIDDKGREQEFLRVPRGTEPVSGGFGWTLARVGDGFVVCTEDIDRVLHFGPKCKDGLHHLAAISDRNGNSIRFERDANGVLRGMVDSAGRPYRVTTDGKGRILSVAVAISPEPHDWMEVIRYDYDSAGDLVAVTDAEGHVDRYRYDNHLIVQHETPCGLSFMYRYDGRTNEAYCIETWGEYVGRIDPALEHPIAPPAPGEPDRRPVKGIHYRRFTYVKPQRYTEVEDGLGGITRYFGDSAGRAVRIVRSSGAVIERAFDPSTGALIGESDPDGEVRAVRIDARGASAGFIDRDGKGRRTVVDRDGYEHYVDDRTGAVIKRLYDARRNLVFTEYPDGSREEWEYDDRGLLRHYINRLGGMTRYRHDAMGNCTVIQYGDGTAEATEYDYLGRPIKHWDRAGQTTEWGYDRRSEIVYKRHADGGEVFVTRDANRRPVRYEEAGRVWRYEYGGLAWLIKTTDPDGAETEFRYDVAQNMTLVRNARGQVFRQEFDYANRCVAITTFEGVRIEIGNDAAYKPLWMQTAAGRVVLVQDDAGRLGALETPDGTIQFEYGAGGFSVIDDGTTRVEIEYDALGRVVRDRQGAHENRVSWNGHAVAAIESDVGLPVRYHRRNKFEAITSMEVGRTVIDLDVPNGQDLVLRLGKHLVLRRGFGPTGRLVRQSLARYDVNVPAEIMATGADPNLIGWAAYEYDQGGYLRRERRFDGSVVEYTLSPSGQILRRETFRDGQLVDDERIAYDAAGTPALSGVTFDDLRRPASRGNERFEYDVVGRLSRRETDVGVWSYEWNALDQLVRVTAPDHVVEMEYDGRNRRLHKRVLRDGNVVKDVRYVWNNKMLLHEIDELTGATRTYVERIDEFHIFGHVDVRDGVETPCFYILDAADGIDHAVDADGNVVWSADQTTFKHCIPTQEDVRVSLRFANQHYDEDVELVYNFFRWYDPRVGLFVTTDPWLLDGTLNPRDYASNPIRFFDPLGLMGGHPGVGAPLDPNDTADYAPSPPKKQQMAPKPNGVDGLTGDYLSKPGHWAKPGDADPPGYASPDLTNGSLDSNNRDKFGYGKKGTPQHAVDKAGQAYGCHSCGRKDSGYGDDPATGIQHWTCDHQPPKKLYDQSKGAPKKTHDKSREAGAVRFYPQCKWCASKQGGFVSGMDPKTSAATTNTLMANQQGGKGIWK